MKAFVPFLVLSFSITRIAFSQESKLDDYEAIQAYKNSILQALKDGQYDLLEDQFKEVRDLSIQTQGGTPKVWAYFRVFDLADETKHKTLDDIKR